MRSMLAWIGVPLVSILAASWWLSLTMAQDDLRSSVPPDMTVLQVRYADARMRLAEVELEQALEMNRKVAKTVSKQELNRLRTNIEVARRQLFIAKDYTHGSTLPVQLKAAEANLALATQDLQMARQANKIRRGTISENQMRRLEIKVELADIRVAQWKDPNYIPSLIDQMQWQIDRLTEQVIELNERLDRFEMR